MDYVEEINNRIIVIIFKKFNQLNNLNKSIYYKIITLIKIMELVINIS